MAEEDLLEEVVAVAGRDLRILRPRDPEALLDERAFEHEEYLPYWAELWPSGIALARAVGSRALRGAPVLELGCGLAVPSIAAALAGGRVLATDWAPDGLRLARRNAERNGAAVETARLDWTDPPAGVLARGPWPLVLAADVLYERRNAEPLRALLPRLVRPGGEVWLADPGRPALEGFLAACDPDWTREERRDADHPFVTVHRLRPRARAGRMS